MGHEIYQVTAFKKVKPFILEVVFNDGTSQIINFLPVLRGDLYGPLRNPLVFDQVSIDPEVNTLVWPNGADFDPAILHDWPKSGPALKKLAEGWQSREESARANSQAEVLRIRQLKEIYSIPSVLGLKQSVGWVERERYPSILGFQDMMGIGVWCLNPSYNFIIEVKDVNAQSPASRRGAQETLSGTVGLTVTEAAKALGISRKSLSAILNGRVGISPEMAIRLSIV